MPKYRVLVRSFINNGLREEGEIVDYEGKVGSNLELIEKASASAEEPSKKWAPKAKRGADDSVEG